MTIGTVLIFFIVIVVIIISVKPLVMSYAYEIGGVVRQTRPLIFSGLGIRAQWPRASSWEVRRNARIERCGAGKRGASIVISCDDLIRRHTVFYPCRDGIELVDGKVVGRRTAAAVGHVGDHEQPGKRMGFSTHVSVHLAIPARD